VAPRAVVDENLLLPKRVAVPIEKDEAGTTKPWTSTAPKRISRAANVPPCVLDLVARLVVMFPVVWVERENRSQRKGLVVCCRVRKGWSAVWVSAWVWL